MKKIFVLQTLVTLCVFSSSIVTTQGAHLSTLVYLTITFITALFFRTQLWGEWTYFKEASEPTKNIWNQWVYLYGKYMLSDLSQKEKIKEYDKLSKKRWKFLIALSLSIFIAFLYYKVQLKYTQFEYIPISKLFFIGSLSVLFSTHLGHLLIPVFISILNVVFDFQSEDYSWNILTVFYITIIFYTLFIFQNIHKENGKKDFEISHILRPVSMILVFFMILFLVNKMIPDNKKINEQQILTQKQSLKEKLSIKITEKLMKYSEYKPEKHLQSHENRDIGASNNSGDPLVNEEKKEGKKGPSKLGNTKGTVSKGGDGLKLPHENGLKESSSRGTRNFGNQWPRGENQAQIQFPKNATIAQKDFDDILKRLGQKDIKNISNLSDELSAMSEEDLAHFKGYLDNNKARLEKEMSPEKLKNLDSQLRKKLGEMKHNKNLPESHQGKNFENPNYIKNKNAKSKIQKRPLNDNKISWDEKEKSALHKKIKGQSKKVGPEERTLAQGFKSSTGASQSFRKKEEGEKSLSAQSEVDSKNNYKNINKSESNNQTEKVKNHNKETLSNTIDKVGENKRKKNKKDVKLKVDKILNLISRLFNATIFIFALLLLYYFITKLFKKEDREDTQKPKRSLQKIRILKSEMERLKNMNLKSEEEILKSYYVFLNIMGETPLLKAPSQTVTHYYHYLKNELPEHDNDIKILTEYFCDVYYGKKQFDNIEEFRNSRDHIFNYLTKVS